MNNNIFHLFGDSLRALLAKNIIHSSFASNETMRRNGLKGQKALSPGQRPGCKGMSIFALKGQKHNVADSAFALSGRWLRTTLTQGVALGWGLSGLSGRPFGNKRPGGRAHAVPTQGFHYLRYLSKESTLKSHVMGKHGMAEGNHNSPPPGRRGVFKVASDI